MAITQSKGERYDHPNSTVVRLAEKYGIGGAATTAFGAHRFWVKAFVKSIYAVVTVADAASSSWQAYYSPVGTPDGSADVAIGAAWAVSNGAAGTTKTIDLSGLTASGALAVDELGYPILNPGDMIYLKTGSSNGANGRIDVGYEYQWTHDHQHN
jgi:hypothetical protein